jgi:hypothetical protein
MKKVSLSLTQVNYLIEESFNSGYRSGQSAQRYLRSECIHQDQLDRLKEVKDGLYSEFKFDNAHDQNGYFNAFSHCICILADWRANKVTLQPDEDKRIGELIGAFENIHNKYENEALQESKQTFSDRLMETYHSAKATIDELVKLHNGSFVVYESSAAYDEDEECLTDDFLETSTSIIVNTTFNDNETVYLLKLEGSEIYYITEHGTIDSVDIQFVDDHTVCDIADWIVACNLIEKAQS